VSGKSLDSVADRFGAPLPSAVQPTVSAREDFRTKASTG
jgi:hypothetical protein